MRLHFQPIAHGLPPSRLQIPPAPPLEVANNNKLGQSTKPPMTPTTTLKAIQTNRLNPHLKSHLPQTLQKEVNNNNLDLTKPRRF